MEEDCITVEFLFDIIKQVKDFYETSVVFLTKKDYSDIIFNAMCRIRLGLIEEVKKEELLDTIVDVHLQWLRAVNEIDNFKSQIEVTPRDLIYDCTTYTIDAMGYRLKYFQRYIEKYRKSLSDEQIANVMAELELVEDMHQEVVHDLHTKLKCFKNYAGDVEFHLKIRDAADELLQWVDKIHDYLSIRLSKYFNVHLPQLSVDLTKTLQEIVDAMAVSCSESAQKLIDELRKKGKEIGSLLRCTGDHNLEINKVVDKIYCLEDRIKVLGNEGSAAVVALQHKKNYLERRLSSLEDLKMNLTTFLELTETKDQNVSEQELCACEDYYQLKIFNHSLPDPEKQQLVTRLCTLWNLAMFGEKGRRSMISILSAADVKEEYFDELGTFYVDAHSRKIYMKPDDNNMYQQNEKNELVPMSDDTEHIYFYDECGRYYVEATTQERIYKAHGSASEYMLDSSGILLKTKELLDGVTYYYDNFGRYYIDDKGKHIYRELDSVSEYENDGLGNLVRIRTQAEMFDMCPDDVHVSEECQYLQFTVGRALRVCIAEVILRQPADPIKYLAARLDHYRETLEERDRRTREKEELEVERQIRFAEEQAAAERAAREAALLEQGGSEASDDDTNLLNYTSMHRDDITTDASELSPSPK